MMTEQRPAIRPVEEILDADVYGRIVRSLHHEEGDRVPIWDLIDNRPTYDHFAPGETDALKASVAVYHGLGIDLCRGFTFPFAEEQEGTRREDGGFEYTVLGRTHWISKRPWQTPADLAEVKIPEVSVDHYLEKDLPRFLEQREAFAPRTMLVPGGGCGYHAAYGHVGTVLFLEAIYEARDEVERLVWAFNQHAVARAQAFADANLCPIYFIGDDIAYKGATMASPQFLRETFIPALARTCGPVKKAGMKVIFHSDGYVMEVLDDMIEAGIDGLNPIEPLAGMDIGYLKKRYGKHLVLVGNVDCSQLLPLGSVEEIREGVRACLHAAAAGGGHFIGSSSEIVPATPLENVLAFYEACHELGTYPLRIQTSATA
ncbi:MAG: uroporphyrinogen decarboxylase family protein [Armatimonadota bacterium]